MRQRNVVPGCFAVLILLCASLSGQSKPAADLIVTNAKVWTADKVRPQAEAFAVVGNRIVGVGSAAEMDAWHGPQTRVV
ncbi:MAG: amidohydrolase, partial [Actinomycetota bacterium]